MTITKEEAEQVQAALKTNVATCDKLVAWAIRLVVVVVIFTICSAVLLAAVVSVRHRLVETTVIVGELV